MKKVAAVLSRKGSQLATVSPDTSVVDALTLMAENNIGSVVVLKDGNYMGIMTERDYSRKVILKGKNSSETKVADIMSDDLPRVSPNDSIEYCMELMTDRHIRYMPVFDNDRLAGIISMSDVVKETILAQKETIDHLQNYIRQ